MDDPFELLLVRFHGRYYIYYDPLHSDEEIWIGREIVDDIPTDEHDYQGDECFQFSEDEVC